MKVVVDIASLYVGNAAATTLRATLTDAAGAVVGTTDVSGVSAQFDNVETGTYTAVAQRLDGASAVLGDELTYDFLAVTNDSDQSFYGAGINVTVVQDPAAA